MDGNAEGARRLSAIEFAMHIDAGIVVIFLIGRRYTKADEHNRGIDVALGFGSSFAAGVANQVERM